MKTTLAPAWLLLAALALGTASCSQTEDALPTHTPVARGDEPMHISIAPKPGFDAGDAHTRSTVDDATGNFTWEASEDCIFVVLTFDDAATTTHYQNWSNMGQGNSPTPVAGWNVRKEWAKGTGTAVTTMTWPVGASTCKLQAFYTNSSYSSRLQLSGIKYTNGMGDHMLFEKTFAVGDPLEVAFRHQTTRVTFKGLKPTTAYSLKVNGTAPTFPTTFKQSPYGLGDYEAQTFTTDANGTFILCLPLTADASGEVKLELLTGGATATDTPVSVATLKAQGTTGAWVTDGLRYTVNVKDYAGDTNPDTRPDLLPPPPIVAGATVYNLNGYYITQPDADPAKTYQWSSILTSTTMTNDPCKAAGNGWRLPTMKDFETMAGWGTSNPWMGSHNASTQTLPNATAFKAVFPSLYLCYWSSEERTASNTLAWVLSVESGGASYAYRSKNGNNCIRCVQNP